MNKRIEAGKWRWSLRSALLLTAAIAVVPAIAWAQWNTNGDHIYATNNGNVGIGTSSPQALLSLGTDIGLRKLALWDGVDDWYGLGIDYGTLRFQIGSSIARFGFFSGDTTEVMTIQGNGNVGIGTTSPSSKLHVAGDVTVTGNIAAKYQDLAEWVPAGRRIEPGTVVTLDPDLKNSVVPSASPYDTRVAGVVSAQPGIVLGEAGVGKVKVATTGRVKVRVDATVNPIRIGDLLVTSAKEGMAMRSEAVDVAGIEIHRPGTLIGKALEPLEFGQGEILVLLSLQ